MLHRWRKGVKILVNYCEINHSFQISTIRTGSRNLSQDFSPDETKSNGNNLKNHGGKGRFMRCWELHSYGKPPELQLTITAKIPIIKDSKDLLVKVHASSINPIDVLMSDGYGSGSINVLRHFISTSSCFKPSILSTMKLASKGSLIEFPLTLGRDFAGVVTEVGNGVKDIRIGDEVFGVVGIHRHGSHADFVLTSSEMVRQKPKNLNFIEASSLPYVGLTAWSAIHITGNYHSLNGKKFLILGGSGGVGTFAIQYLKTRGAYVVSTCSPDALQLLGEVGCNFAIDYKDPDYISHIHHQAPFDCILDLTGTSSHPELFKFLSPAIGQYITLSPPLISNMDKYGFLGGFAMNLNDLALHNIKSLSKDKVLTKWAFFIPCGQALDSITSLAASGKIRPMIEEIFKFNDLPNAYERMGLGHSRGKIMIDFN